MADKTIWELAKLPGVIQRDGVLLVCSLDRTAYHITGTDLMGELGTILEGHGGIDNITVVDGDVSTEGNGRTHTMTVTYGDGTTPSRSFVWRDGWKGDTGPAATIHIKWCAVDPSSVTTPVLLDSPDKWIGIYADGNQTASSDWTDYDWYKWIGPAPEIKATMLAYAVQAFGDYTGVPPEEGWSDALPSGLTGGTYLWVRVTVRFDANNSDGYTDVVWYSVGYRGRDAVGSAQLGTITIPGSGWSSNGNVYSIVLGSSAYEGLLITEASKVDLQADSEVVSALSSDNVSMLYIENNDGTLTAYAIDGAPTSPLPVQCCVWEVG